MPAAIGAIRIAQLATQDDAETTQLPEDRYRMLTTGGKNNPSGDGLEVEEQLVDEVEELTELAMEPRACESDTAAFRENADTTS